MMLSEQRQHPPVIGLKLARELDQYKGRWVAIDDKRQVVMGTGASASEAIEAAREQGFADPVLFRVPTHTRRVRIRRACWGEPIFSSAISCSFGMPRS